MTDPGVPSVSGAGGVSPQVAPSSGHEAGTGPMVPGATDTTAPPGGAIDWNSDSVTVWPAST